MIKAFIFDLGGVLFTDGTRKFIDWLSEKYSVERKKINELMNGELGSLYRESKITRDEFWKRFILQTGIDADVDVLERSWIEGYELIEGTRDIIHELSKKYKVYFLSDNVEERAAAIDERYGFLSWFDGGVFSYIVGVRKPNPKIYKAVLDQAKVEPDEAVFIDDKPEFLLPAEKLGMKTLYFQTPEKLRKELINNKILK